MKWQSRGVGRVKEEKTVFLPASHAPFPAFCDWCMTHAHEGIVSASPQKKNTFMVDYACSWRFLNNQSLPAFNLLIMSALMPALSNKGATCCKYTRRALPFLLLGLITTFNLRGLVRKPDENSHVRITRLTLIDTSFLVPPSVVDTQSNSVKAWVDINDDEFWTGSALCTPGFQGVYESITYNFFRTAVLQLILANQILAKGQLLCTNFV